MNFYLVNYLIIGVLTIFILLFFNKKDDDKLYFLNVNNERFSLSWFLDEVLVPFLGFMFIIIAWPLVIGMLLKEKFFPPEPYVPEEEIVFEVKPEDLLTKQSISEIEEAEIVYDPLNAAPEIPFGHLNQAWNQFKNKIQTRDEIWSFSVMFKPEYGDEHIRSGYVFVRDNNPTDIFFECD